MINLKLIWKIAARYMWGKGSTNAVPVLSRISMVAITVGSAAMVIIFSVFNGFDLLVKVNYKAFYPDIKITATHGKFFSASAININVLSHTPGVQHIAPVIEDIVLATEESDIAGSNNEQIIVTLKGIDSNYLNVNNIRQYMKGADSVSSGQDQTAIVGLHNLHVLGADINNVFSKIALFYQNPTVKNITEAPDDAFEELKLHPAGVFHVEGDFEAKYILAPIALTQQLFHQQGMYSSLEISIAPEYERELKEVLQKSLGNTFKIETRFEQNKTLYMVMGTEKWAVYFILLMVIGIASFNMVGALGMLVLEKRKDIAILRAMGAETGTLKKIFLLEGILWSLTGGISGIVIGCLVCMAQQYLKIIKLSGDFVVEAYPVKIEVTDLLLVIATVVTVGLLASWYPAMRATATTDPTLKST